MAVFNTNYISSLVGHDKDRYETKIKLCGFDPYETDLKCTTNDIDMLPDVTHGDIVQYLVFTTCSVSLEQMKAYKSMQAHNFFTSGWVEEVRSKVLNEIIVVFATVKHSYRLNEPSLKVWIATKKAGEILTAHCNCMDGVGEGCSHVGAVLFALEFATHKKQSTSCTSKGNRWLPPSVKEVPLKEIRCYEFISSKKKYKNLTDLYKGITGKKRAKKNEVSTKKKKESLQNAPGKVKTARFRTKRKKIIHEETTIEKRNEFLQKASELGAKCIVMAVLPDFSNKYVRPSLPQSLSHLFKKQYMYLDLEELRLKSISIFENLSITEAEVNAVEKATRKQSQCDIWYEQRAGRITASQMKKTIHTNPMKPALSTLTGICYPKEQKFFSPYTEWGKKNEDVAKEKYEEENKPKHEGFFIKKSCGFKISVKHPFIGASPDGIVFCKCHKPKLLEIKCPCTPIEGKLLVNGTLPRDHSYYFQIQTQLLVWDMDECELVVWRLGQPLETVVIVKDEKFVEKMVQDAALYYKVAVLPELLGRYFTSRKDTPLGDVNYEPQLICLCQRPAAYPMITCQNPNCKIKRFHYKCVGVKGKRSKWMCSKCQLLEKKK